MRFLRLGLAAALVPAVLVAAPADAATKRPARPVVVKVVKAKPAQYTLLPGVGPCHMTILRFIPSLGGVYKICG